MKGSAVSAVNVQLSPGDLSAQVAQMSDQRNEMSETIAKLRAEIARQQGLIGQLQEDRAKQDQVISALWDMVYPPEKVNEDLKNYPPLEQCHSLGDLLAELRDFSKTVKEQTWPTKHITTFKSNSKPSGSVCGN